VCAAARKQSKGAKMKTDGLHVKTHLKAGLEAKEFEEPQATESFASEAEGAGFFPGEPKQVSLDQLGFSLWGIR
jgi:hypothetical protein